MLTRFSAKGAAAATAAVVAPAASVASEAARGLDGRTCAGRCLPAKHTRVGRPGRGSRSPIGYASGYHKSYAHAEITG